MLGFLIVYFKGMRIMMFQLSGYYCKDHILVKLVLVYIRAPHLLNRPVVLRSLNSNFAAE